MKYYTFKNEIITWIEEGAVEIESPIREDGTVLPLHKNLDLLAVDENGELFSKYLTVIDATTGKYEADTTSIDADAKTKSISDLSNAVQGLLDSEAQKVGYDNIVSACSYVGSINFGVEAQSFLDWRDACWTYCYTQLALVEAGTRAMPTAEELVLELPTRVI